LICHRGDGLAGTGMGAMYYIETSGQTVEMTTSNYGDTWA
jgi:hypothetical protein